MGAACRRCGSRDTRLVMADGAPDALERTVKTLEEMAAALRGAGPLGAAANSLANRLARRSKHRGAVLVCSACGHWGHP